MITSGHYANIREQPKEYGNPDARLPQTSLEELKNLDHIETLQIWKQSYNEVTFPPDGRLK